MESLHSQLHSLNSKIHLLIEENSTLVEKKRLEKALDEKKTLEKQHLEALQNLEDENKKLKVVSAISGNDEYKKLMKLQLNKLIKEIDLCITELKSS